MDFSKWFGRPQMSAIGISYIYIRKCHCYCSYSLRATAHYALSATNRFRINLMRPTSQIKYFCFSSLFLFQLWPDYVLFLQVHWLSNKIYLLHNYVMCCASRWNLSRPYGIRHHEPPSHILPLAMWCDRTIAFGHIIITIIISIKYNRQ